MFWIKIADPDRAQSILPHRILPMLSMLEDTFFFPASEQERGQSDLNQNAAGMLLLLLMSCHILEIGYGL